MKRDLSKFLEQVRFDAGTADVDLRLDHFLVDKLFWRSRTDIQRRVKAGAILLNGRPSKASRRLEKGDVVTVIVSPEDLPDQDPNSIEIEVLHEDDAIVVVDKQPGLVVHPTGRHVYDTLMNALHLRYRVNGDLDKGMAPHVVHRLDRDTSGVLVVAKTDSAKKFLQDAFEARRPRKTYLAICEGRFVEPSGVIEAPLGSDPAAEIRIKMCTRADGLPSRTRYDVVESVGDMSLVRVHPETGRQHQIRVHLASIGHPIAADPLYGDPRGWGIAGATEAILDRQALHAETLDIEHPTTGRSCRFTAEPAPDMKNLLDALRRGVALERKADNQSARWQSPPTAEN